MLKNFDKKSPTDKFVQAMESKFVRSIFDRLEPLIRRVTSRDQTVLENLVLKMRNITEKMFLGG
jgi:hypothetical protein